MRFMKSTLPILAALLLSILSVSPVFASSKKSESEKKIQATVVTMTDDTLVVRSGNKDTVFKIDSSTRRAEGINAGNKVTVNYRNDGKKHVATDIELSKAN